MGSFSGLGIGLSFLFGCILMGLVAELYYLVWWKKKLAKTNSITSSSNDSNIPTEIQEFSLLFCWRKPKSCSSQELANNQNHQEIQDLEIGSTAANKEQLGLKCEEGIEAELMRVHNLCGPPRFLFTIKEESKEDLESDGGRSRKGSRTRSLSDLFLAVDGVTPMASPTSLDSYNYHGVNPLFESTPAAELSRLRSSPPPKFKFLRDAEEKLVRRLLQEDAERKILGKNLQDSDSETVEQKCGSFVKFLNVRDQIHSQATQVLPLPLPSSPTLQHRG